MFFWVFPRRQIVVGQEQHNLAALTSQPELLQDDSAERAHQYLLSAESKNASDAFLLSAERRYWWARSAESSCSSSGWLVSAAKLCCSWPTKIWRRGNTQKNIFNIQITAKVWNQQYSPFVLMSSPPSLRGTCGRISLCRVLNVTDLATSRGANSDRREYPSCAQWLSRCQVRVFSCVPCETINTTKYCLKYYVYTRPV